MKKRESGRREGNRRTLMKRKRKRKGRKREIVGMEGIEEREKKVEQ